MKGIILSLMLLCVASAGQTQTPKMDKREPKAPPKTPLPVYEIILQDQTDYPSIPWRAASYGNVIETVCNGDRNVYVWKQAFGLVGLTPKGIVSFLKDKLIDIPHPNLTFIGSGASVSNSGIYFRATGYKDDDVKIESRVETDEQGHSRVVQDREVLRTRQYIARFDKDGHYDGAIADLPFSTYQLAAFDSGSLVVQGLDERNIPRLALLNASGQVLRYLELPKDLSTAQQPTSLDSHCDGCTADIRSVVSNSYFTLWRVRVLVLRGLTKNPRVYEIRESGEVRAVDVASPEGYSHGWMLASDTNWLMRFAKTDADGVWSLFEVDPENGKLLREYRVKTPDAQLSCFSDGEFWGVRHDVKEGNLKVVRGIAQPYRGD